jgi:hypothetical protein
MWSALQATPGMEGAAQASSGVPPSAQTSGTAPVPSVAPPLGPPQANQVKHDPARESGGLRCEGVEPCMLRARESEGSPCEGLELCTLRARESEGSP